jgi:putative hydrolase of the HAD superfamily
VSAADVPSISLVIFDLGRVLVRICDDWNHACALAGVSAPAGELSAADRAAAEAVVARYDRGMIDLDSFARQIGPILGQPREHVVAAQEIYLRGAYPGAAELIEDLSRAGVRTACLSNTTEIHWRMMLDPASPHFLPLERMTWRFASFQLGCRKPDDSIYQCVERDTQAEPRSILFFDDVEANVAAAARRGWNAELIRADCEPIAQARTHLARRGVLRNR